MAFGYVYALERGSFGWWVVRFPDVPQAIAEAETEEQARSVALDCLISALEGYVEWGWPLPRRRAAPGAADCAILPSLVTAKLFVHETMLKKGWSRSKLAAELDVTENAVRRLLDLKHNSQMWIIDDALACMGRCLPIEMPKLGARGNSA